MDIQTVIRTLRKEGRRIFAIPTMDELLTPATAAELAANARRVAKVMGLDLGLVSDGNLQMVRTLNALGELKSALDAITSRKTLGDATAGVITGLGNYARERSENFGNELGKSRSEAGPAGSIAFTTTPDLITPEGARAEVNANREIGERWNAENRRRAGQEELPTDARDEEPETRKPWHGSGTPQEAGQVIDGRRRKVADGVLGDLPRNRSIGEDWNRRLRKLHGQPELY